MYYNSNTNNLIQTRIFLLFDSSTKILINESEFLFPTKVIAITITFKHRDKQSATNIERDG